jgi:hypothetical protein
LLHNPFVEPDPEPASESAQERARHAFEHAVEHEREAIVAHEAAAVRHDNIADQQEQAALSAPDELRDRMADLAARERGRAVTARGRADAVRERLRSEGVDPGV